MIRPLRQRHQRIFLALGMLLPVVFFVGLAMRRSVPTLAASAAPFAPVQTFGQVVVERNDFFPKSEVTTRLWRNPAVGGGFAVSLIAGKSFLEPDVMVYWTAQAAPKDGTLPADSVWLGNFGAGVLPLPAVANLPNGALLLYSVANAKVVDVSESLEKLMAEAGSH